MSEQLEEVEVFSIADFAEIDGESVTSIVQENTPAGKFALEVTEASMEEKETDNGNRIIVAITATIQEAYSCATRGVELDSLIGKKHVTRHTIVTDEGKEKFLEGIGYLKGLIEFGFKVPAEEIVGSPADWVSNLEGHRFDGHYVARPNKQNPQRPFINLEVIKPRGR